MKRIKFVALPLFKIRSAIKTFSLLAPLLFSLNAQTAVIGMLQVDIGLNTSFGVEENDDDYYFLIDIDKNSDRVEHVFALGNPFNPNPVLVIEGKPVVQLSIYDGRKHGFVDSEAVKLHLESKVDRSSQRTSLTKDIKAMAKLGRLTDKDGKVYKYTELKGVLFVFQFLADGDFDASLDGKVCYFDSIADGEYIQLYGKTKLKSKAKEVKAVQAKKKNKKSN